MNNSIYILSPLTAVQTRSFSMKKAILVFVFGFAVCAGLVAGGKKEAPEGQFDTPAQAATAKKPQHAAAASPYFEGNGGKGMKIAVLQIEGHNLPASEVYILSLIQGSITGDFQKFSDMTVIDRLSEDKALAEINRGEQGYTSEAEYLQIGKMLGAQYYLSGSVTKTSSAYMLELFVTETETEERKASYPPKSCSLREIDSLTAVKAATADILAQLGVRLTDAGKAALRNISANQVDAETALSKSIAAQKGSGGKTTFESYQYLYEAKALDPNLTEAVQRLASFQAVMIAPPRITQPVLQAPSTGNIGADARNEVARYKAEREQIIAQQKFYLKQRDDLLEQQKVLLQKQWELITMLRECDDFYKSHPPFEIYYDPGLERYGAVDFQNETITMRFKVCSVPVADFGAVQSIIQGLEGLKTGFESINRALDSVQGEIDKVNKAGTETYAVQPVTGVRAGDKTTGAAWTVLPNWAKGSGRRFDIAAALQNEQGKVIGRTTVTLTNPLIENDVFQPDTAWAYASFGGVKIDDITDTLTTVITGVNGVKAEQAGSGGYVKIAAKTLEDTDYFAGGYNWQGFNRKGYTAEQAPLISAGCNMFTANGRKMLAAPASTEFEANWNDAIAKCKSLKVNGIGGWRLPTKDELDAMYLQLKKKGLGGFSNGWYWSSSESSSTSSWGQSFSDGYQVISASKTNSFSVRAVRAF